MLLSVRRRGLCWFGLAGRWRPVLETSNLWSFHVGLVGTVGTVGTVAPPYLRWACVLLKRVQSGFLHLSSCAVRRLRSWFRTRCARTLRRTDGSQDGLLFHLLSGPRSSWSLPALHIRHRSGDGTPRRGASVTGGCQGCPGTSPFRSRGLRCPLGECPPGGGRLARLRPSRAAQAPLYRLAFLTQKAGSFSLRLTRHFWRMSAGTTRSRASGS